MVYFYTLSLIWLCNAPIFSSCWIYYKCAFTGDFYWKSMLSCCCLVWSADVCFIKNKKTRCWIYAELQFEECPKWLAVRDVLSEIEAEIENNPQISANDCSSTCSIMIVAQDDRACSQIRDVRLTFSELTVLNTWYIILICCIASLMLLEMVLFVICYVYCHRRVLLSTVSLLSYAYFP